MELTAPVNITAPFFLALDDCPVDIAVSATLEIGHGHGLPTDLALRRGLSDQCQD